MSSPKESVIVIDNGSYTIKAGFSDDDIPRCIFPTIIAKPRYHGHGCWKPVFNNVGNRVPYKTNIYNEYNLDPWIGDETHEFNKDSINITVPVINGIITNWDNMEKLWYYTFYNKLLIAPEEHPILLTNNVFDSIGNKQKLIQIMFEVFNVPLINIQIQNVLSLYSSARLNGIVLDSGYNKTDIVPIYEGHGLKYLSKQLKIGGYHLTVYLQKLLKEKGYSFITYKEKEIVKDIKEKYCYVSTNCNDDDIVVDQEYKYKLPDGNNMNIVAGLERVCCTEILFKPSMIDIDNKGIDKLLYESIKECNDNDLKQECYSNIILSGGNTRFDGLNERIEKEISLISKCKVYNDLNKQNSVWLGGAILSSLSNFEETSANKDEYDEIGPNIVYKCF